MGSAPLDITGERYGKLVAVKSLGKRGGHVYWWRCVCDCGNYVEAQVSQLRYQSPRSCGCGRSETLKANGYLSKDAVLINYNGKTQTLAAWAREFNLSYDMVKKRYQRGWPPEDLFARPNMRGAE